MRSDAPNLLAPHAKPAPAGVLTPVRSAGSAPGVLVVLDHVELAAAPGLDSATGGREAEADTDFVDDQLVAADLLAGALDPAPR